MKIINEKLGSDFMSGNPVRLELGSGGMAREGFYGVDIKPLPGVSIVADLNLPMEMIPSNSVSEIASHHCLEHVENIIGLMEEIHRIMMPGGLIRITVPHFSNPYYYSDPTHRTFFGLYTFYYFSNLADQPARRKVPFFYTDIRFRVTEIKISLMSRSLFQRLRWPFLGKFVNSELKWMEWYERRLCWQVPAEQISYCLKVIK